MESLAGKEKLPEFVAAYEKLIARMSGGGKRRIVLLHPHVLPDRRNAIQNYAIPSGTIWLLNTRSRCFWVSQYDFGRVTRDGVHMPEKLYQDGPGLICEI